MRNELNDDEAMLVATVRAFIDRDVKPTVREVEHANSYPEAWIEQMKHIGIYGLAIDEQYGGSPVSMPCYVQVTQELARGWMSLAGAMGGHTVVAKLLTLFGTEEQRRTYLPPMASGELRATMALTEPGGGSDLQNMSTTALADGPEGSAGLLIDVDQQRPPVRTFRGAVQDRPERHTAAPRHVDRARRTRAGTHGVAGLAEVGLQGRRILRAVVRQPPGAGLGDPGRSHGSRLFADDEGT